MNQRRSVGNAQRIASSDIHPTGAGRARNDGTLARVQAPYGRLNLSRGLSAQLPRTAGHASDSVSIALDDLHAAWGRLALDYKRASTFALGLFNGHLDAANSDVRAGDERQDGTPGMVRVSKLVAERLGVCASSAFLTRARRPRCSTKSTRGRQAGCQGDGARLSAGVAGGR